MLSALLGGWGGGEGVGRAMGIPDKAAFGVGLQMATTGRGFYGTRYWIRKFVFAKLCGFVLAGEVERHVAISVAMY